MHEMSRAERDRKRDSVALLPFFPKKAGRDVLSYTRTFYGQPRHIVQHVGLIAKSHRNLFGSSRLRFPGEHWSNRKLAREREKLPTRRRLPDLGGSVIPFRRNVRAIRSRARLCGFTAKGNRPKPIMHFSFAGHDQHRDARDARRASPNPRDRAAQCAPEIEMRMDDHLRARNRRAADHADP